MGVTTQLREVEVRELKPKYKVKVTMDEFYYLSRTGVTKWSDRRFKCYTKDKRALIVAQRTTMSLSGDSEDNDDERLRLSLTV